MRMWLVPPQYLCRKHLLGEHVELHMLVGAINKGKMGSVRGLARDGFVDTRQAARRHAELVSEMQARGMNHQSELPAFDDPELGSVDVNVSVGELIHRCPTCFNDLLR